MAKANQKLISDLLRRKDQERREHAERERIRPRVSPRLKSVASGASWAVGSSMYKNPAPQTCVPTRATRGASQYSLRPERSLIEDVNGAGVCLGVSKPGGGSERAGKSASRRCLSWRNGGPAGGLAANAASGIYGLNGRKVPPGSTLGGNQHKVGHRNDRRPRSSPSSPSR